MTANSPDSIIGAPIDEAEAGVERKQKGAVLYDFLQVRGGAEAVTLEIASVLSASILCVGFIGEDMMLPGAFEGADVAVISLGKPIRNRAFQYLSGISRFRRKTRFLQDCDWVVYSGSNAPAAVRHASGRNILYCHAPPRFAYDLKDYWESRASWWQLLLLRLLARYVRHYYEKALRQMDVVIVNSENVRRRMLHYFGRDSIVVHPPCDTRRFRWISQENFYLSTSRLEPYKRVGRVVEAFLRMPEKNLVVCSGGSELESLREMASGAGNILVTGWVDQDALADFIGRTIATLYIPVDEDFGMSPVESMAAGKPVIGVAEGGLQETVMPGETGLLLPADPSVDDIVEAVRGMTPERALLMREACQVQAERFGREVFRLRMRQVLGFEDEEGLQPLPIDSDGSL